MLLLIRLTILLLLGVLFCLCAPFLITGNAIQDKDRVIELRSNSPTPNEPVKVVTVKTKKGKIEPGKKFIDENDWFKDLTVEVEKVSDKDIIYINIGLSFERPEDHASAHEPPLVHSLTFGRRISVAELSPPTDQLKVLARGEVVDLSLPTMTYNTLKEVLVKLRYPVGVKRIRLYVREVIFADDTLWSAGRIFRRAPDRLDKWVPIGKRQSGARGTAFLMELGWDYQPFKTLRFDKASLATARTAHGGM